VVLGPAMGIQSNLTLRALLPFARNCPNLRKLGLYLHATETDLPSVSEIPRPLSKLSELHVGLSNIEDPEAVALFLSRICPADCSIEAGKERRMGRGPFLPSPIGEAQVRGKGCPGKS